VQTPFHLRQTGTPLRLWLLPLMPALGGLLSGWLVYSLAPEAAGHGTDSAIDAYHRRRLEGMKRRLTGEA
jgi:CIC family chloride channel protein